MNESATPKGILTSVPPPADLSAFVHAFVRRDEAVTGEVVRILPEARPSIQIMTADPYWIRGRGADEPWRRLPRIALWAPRFCWAYGFAAQRVSAFAVGLTPSGLAAIARVPASSIAGAVLDCRAINEVLAAAIDPKPDDTFEDWIGRAATALRSAFDRTPPVRDLAPALSILAAGEGGAVARAAAAAGLSERQFRRVFEELYGAPPKLYQRALRVDRMVRRLHPQPWEDDTHGETPIAFADQPHANREFREMTGMTPTEYLAAKRKGDKTLRSVAVRGLAPPNDDGDAARY